MTQIFKTAVRTLAIALVGAVTVLHVSTGAEAQGASQARAAQMRAAKAKAMQGQAAKMRMMQARQAQLAQAGMAAAMVTAATLQATDAGECSPYLAKWMMTKSLAAKAQYEACMED